MNVRACNEIEQKRYALKLLRGGFAVTAEGNADEVDWVMNKITG